MADPVIELKDVTAAVEEVNTAFTEFRTKNDERLKEIESKNWDDVVRKDELKRIDDAMTKQQEVLDKFQARMKRIAVYGTGDEAGKLTPEEMDRKALTWARAVGKYREENITEFTHADAQNYKTAFVQYLRKDDKILSADEAKALSVGSDPDGGYVVDPDTTGRVVMKVFETSPVRQYASIQNISTDALEGLFDLNEATTGWVGETDTRAETATPQLGKWRIPVYEQYANPMATQKILDDGSINLESWLADKVSDKMARTENTAFVLGDGVNKPRGFTTYAAGTTLPGTIEQFNTGVNGGFAADPDGGDKLIDALYALKAPYRANAVWFMNRITTSGVRKLKDGDGNYMWQPSLQAGQPASLLGYPQVSLEDMATYTVTGALAIAVGDMRAAYQVVDRVGIRVLRDPYTNKPYVGFYTTKRVGGNVVNFEAIKLVKFAT